MAWRIVMSVSHFGYRDALIGLILIVLGGALLAHSFGFIAVDEQTVVQWAVYCLAALGALLLVGYFLRSESVWLMILAFCLMFVAASIWISYFRPQWSDLIAAALFFFTALAFLILFLSNREQWWALLAGWTCLGLSTVVVLSSRRIDLPLLSAASWQRLAPVVFFGFVAFGFLLLWAIKPRRHWWALLVAGQVAAVGTAGVLHDFGLHEAYAPALLFLISGLTFLLVWLLRSEEHQLGWAIYPAAVLIPLAAFAFLATIQGLNTQIVLAIIFIVLGVIFILGFWRSRVAATGAAEVERYSVFETESPELRESIAQDAEARWRGAAPAVAEDRFAPEESEVRFTATPTGPQELESLGVQEVDEPEAADMDDTIRAAEPDERPIFVGEEEEKPFEPDREDEPAPEAEIEPEGEPEAEQDEEEETHTEDEEEAEPDEEEETKESDADKK